MLLRNYQASDATVGDGRTLHLACVPFDVEATVDDGDGAYREVFRRGAFAHIVKAPNRTELRYQHRQDGLPYGFGATLTEDAHYLVGTFRVADTPQGEQLLGLVRDDQLGGVSIGFVPGSDRTTGDLVERVRVAQLVEVSLTPAATYGGAAVLAVRSQSVDLAAKERARHAVRRLRMR